MTRQEFADNLEGLLFVTAPEQRPTARGSAARAQQQEQAIRTIRNHPHVTRFPDLETGTHYPTDLASFRAAINTLWGIGKLAKEGGSNPGEQHIIWTKEARKWLEWAEMYVARCEKECQSFTPSV